MRLFRRAILFRTIVTAALTVLLTIPVGLAHGGSHSDFDHSCEGMNCVCPHHRHGKEGHGDEGHVEEGHVDEGHGESKEMMMTHGDHTMDDAPAVDGWTICDCEPNASDGLASVSPSVHSEISSLESPSVFTSEPVTPSSEDVPPSHLSDPPFRPPRPSL